MEDYLPTLRPQDGLDVKLDECLTGAECFLKSDFWT